MKVLILGASGMLGSTLYKVFTDNEVETWGTIRNSELKKYFSEKYNKNLILWNDALDLDQLIILFKKIKPDVVINCIGIIKQQKSAQDPLVTLPINSILPHRICNICDLLGIKLILISTDCVFSGKKGMYSEMDVPDATDLYGMSKFIGEIHDKPHVVTIRTSIIGHELNSKNSLVDWFLSSQGRVDGYTKAIFTGFPTVEIANIIYSTKFFKNLFGLYHIAANPINKFELLKIIAKIYEKKIDITESNKVQIDRSLDGKKFVEQTQYIAPDWENLIQRMYNYKIKYMENLNV